MWNLIISHRNSLKLSYLYWHDGAAGVAQVHTNDMATRKYANIVNPEGVDVFQRLSCSSPPVNFLSGEVLSIGVNTSASFVFNQLINDPNYRPTFERATSANIGIGYNNGYWTIIIW